MHHFRTAREAIASPSEASDRFPPSEVPERDPACGPALAEHIRSSDLAGYHHRAARARELRTAQLDLLALEHVACCPGLTLAELGERMGLTSGGITGLTTRLERAGLLSRAPHPRDRRSRALALTSQGAARLQDYLQPIAAPVREAVSALSPRDRAVVTRFLDQLTVLREAFTARPARTPPGS